MHLSEEDIWNDAFDLLERGKNEIEMTMIQAFGEMDKVRNFADGDRQMWIVPRLIIE